MVQVKVYFPNSQCSAKDAGTTGIRFLLSPTSFFPTVLVQLWLGEILGIIVAPQDFGKNLKLRNGTTSHVELVCSLSKCFYSHLMYRLANFVARYEDFVTHRP